MMDARVADVLMAGLKRSETLSGGPVAQRGERLGPRVAIGSSVQKRVNGNHPSGGTRLGLCQGVSADPGRFLVFAAESEDGGFSAPSAADARAMLSQTMSVALRQGRSTQAHDRARG